MRRYLLPFIVIVFSALTLLTGNVYADPPGRVGRISYLQGTVSYYSTHGKIKAGFWRS